MDHEGLGRDGREACDRCRNCAGKARLNNAINEVVEPARYSPHTNLGIGVIADIARRVSATGVTCCKLTRCRIENSVENDQVGALQKAQADGEIARRLDASKLALMLISEMQGASSSRGFTAIETPSIKPLRWPSPCSNRSLAVEQGVAIFRLK
jgi:hypothetical protein